MDSRQIGVDAPKIDGQRHAQELNLQVADYD